MIQGYDPTNGTFLANLSSLMQRMARTNAQLSSGLRVSKPSDDPSSVADILHLQFDISHVQQVTSNLTAIKGSVDTAEAALQDAGHLLDQVVTTGTQGATVTATASQRSVLAQNLGDILGQLVSISQTTYAGQYVFSGDQPSQPAYQLNLASPTGVDRLLTAQSTQLAQDANGATFAVSLTAGTIFDHRNPDDSVAVDNVFAAVNNLRQALLNNDQPGIQAALDSVKTAQTYFEAEHAFYGATQNRITNALTSAQTLQSQYTAALSHERDTDVAAAATELATENLNQQAALQAQANIRRGSLFDYLK